MRADGRAVTLDVQDSGQHVELSVGQLLVVNLTSNPSTGFSWQIVIIGEGVLRQVGEIEFHVTQGTEPHVVGAGGTETLRFEAIGAGRTAVELAYRRPWEKDIAPLEMFTLDVVVR